MSAPFLADTNLVIPLLIEHELRDQALHLFGRDPDWHLPDWWQIELANVLRNYYREGLFPLDDILEIQLRAAIIFPPDNTHPVDLPTTLRVACECGISTCDARFIALSRTCGQKPITEDSRLRQACPDDTISLTEFLSSP